jgi:hypothetical protein
VIALVASAAVNIGTLEDRSSGPSMMGGSRVSMMGMLTRFDDGRLGIPAR